MKGACKMNELDKLFAGLKTPQQPEAVHAPVSDSIPAVEPGSTAVKPLKDQLVELPINLLIDYPKERDPFRPYTENEMAALKEDIRTNGVLQPIVVRPHPTQQNYFEIIAGHNRKIAAQAIGFNVIPAIVRDMDDYTAQRQMIATNLKQRQGLLPSEKAWAYRWQMEAMAHQGFRTDIFEENAALSTAEGTSSQVETKLRSDEIVASGSDDSRAQIQRYIRLTYLLPELLKLVDDKKLAFIVGVELSYLKADNQSLILDFFMTEHPMPISQSMANSFRQLEAQERLNHTELEHIYLAPPTVKKLKTITFKLAKWKNYFPADATEKDVTDIIEKALKSYFDKRS